jgi:hypothetical protein
MSELQLPLNPLKGTFLGRADDILLLRICEFYNYEKEKC